MVRARRWNASAGPLVTKVLLAANVAVFLVTALGGANIGRRGDLMTRLALYGPAVAHGEWYRIVTSGFVHAGLVHLGFNMALLYRLGEALESALGRVRFLALYVAALMAGSLGVLILSPNTFTVGASGAVFGLLGAMAAGLRQRGVGVWQSGIGPLIAVNLVITVVIPGISVGGHVGGLIGGAAVGAALLSGRPSRHTVAVGTVLALVFAVAAGAGAIWVAGLQ
jgi:membrane associated rhomboid family serine protease